MIEPSLEQRSILDSSARVRVVRASPGSGKTWLVAELIRRELATWPAATTGIAALTFTRVGGDEIRKAVGSVLDHPHFVGTIDAFLFRFVVRPFLRLVHPAFAPPRLLPGEWGAEHWHSGRYEDAVLGQERNRVNVFECVWIDELDGEPRAGYRRRSAPSLERLSEEMLARVKTSKKELWKKTGQLTHSDAALWASKLLEHTDYGGIIRAEVVRRFPLMIVDELQDTGHFLGKSVGLLLNEIACRGVVVGDPDQAIFEFNGARPELFQTYEAINGAQTFRLHTTRRCAPAICSAAGHLSDSKSIIKPVAQGSGRAILLTYDDMVTDVRRLYSALNATSLRGSLKIIARRTSTVDALAGRSVAIAPKLGCPALNHMHRAVVKFRQHRQSAAIAAARACLEVAAFKCEGQQDAELLATGIEPHLWQALSVRVLLAANAVPGSGDFLNWQLAVAGIVERELVQFFGESRAIGRGTLRPKKNSGWNKLATKFLPDPYTGKAVAPPLPIHTVHGVKGETHDATIFVCPTEKPSRCPSVIWWSEDERHREERRIAYVAVTRSRGDIYLCTSKPCFQRLSDNRAEFMAAFEHFTIDEFLHSGVPSGR